MWRQLAHLVWRIVIVAGVLLSFIFLAECTRLGLLFYRVNPALGIAFGGLLVGGAVGLLLYLWAGLRAYPRVLVPPPLPELPQASHAEMRRYCKYLIAYVGRLAENPGLDEASVKAALERILDIEDVLGAHPLNDDLVRTIQKTEDEVVRPLLAQLDEKASQEVRRSVRDVMLAVTLSPYPSVDILIVLYRNFGMVLRVMRIYQGRPAPREQWLILRDILVAVATVNFLNISRKLIESLFAQVPIIGRVIDDIGEGLGAGLLTSVTGHAAMDRCTAFRGWNKDDEIRSLGARMANFLADVKDLFTKDLMPELKGRIRAVVSPAQADEPGFWDTITRGIVSAIDMTAKAVDSFVFKPAAAGVQSVATGVQSVASAGSRLGRSVVDAGSSVVHRHAHRHRSAHGGAAQPVRTFFQRLKYTFRGPRLYK